MAAINCLDPGLATLHVQRVVTCGGGKHPKMGGLLNTFWEAESGAISIDFLFLGNFPIAFGVKHVKRHPKLWC